MAIEKCSGAACAKTALHYKDINDTATMLHYFYLGLKYDFTKVFGYMKKLPTSDIEHCIQRAISEQDWSLLNNILHCAICTSNEYYHKYFTENIEYLDQANQTLAKKLASKKKQ